MRNNDTILILEGVKRSSIYIQWQFIATINIRELRKSTNGWKDSQGGHKFLLMTLFWWTSILIYV